MEKVPKVIFIAPYRNRESHLNIFLNFMPFIMEGYEEDYEIYVCHQADERTFNRGAMKNLGFIYAKEKYPDDYKKITFVFNDIDTMPGKKNMFDYRTKSGVVKHFFGFKYALGGIVSLTGEDFEKINGFPNYWSWGYEDNTLQKRVQNNKLEINRDQFYDVSDKNVLQFFHGKERGMGHENDKRFLNDKGDDGITTLKDYKYNVNELGVKSYMIDFKEWNVPTDYRSVPLKDYHKYKGQRRGRGVAMFKMF